MCVIKESVFCALVLLWNCKNSLMSTRYELQILFRMEILQSEIGAIIEESLKQKFVRQICLLLEAIQCHLQGGFFGDWSLDSYVRKIIKDRYVCLNKLHLKVLCLHNMQELLPKSRQMGVHSLLEDYCFAPCRLSLASCLDDIMVYCICYFVLMRNKIHF